MSRDAAFHCIDAVRMPGRSALLGRRVVDADVDAEVVARTRVEKGSAYGVLRMERRDGPARPRVGVPVREANERARGRRSGSCRRWCEERKNEHEDEGGESAPC